MKLKGKFSLPPTRRTVSSTDKKDPSNNLKRSTEASYFPYCIKGDLIMKRIKKENEAKEVPVAKRVEITGIHQDMETKKVILTLEYVYQGKVQTEEIPRGMLTRRKMLELLDIGVDVTELNVIDVIEFLRRQEENIPVSLHHTTLGFGEWEGKQIFKHHNAIGCDSTYRGRFRVEPHGTYDAWFELIRNEAIGNTPLELALVIGLAAPVASLIGRTTAMEILLFHLYGDSSKGKTTATRVAVSTFGYPHIHDSGLIRTWNGTDNAILASLRGNHGFPFAFDEASMLDRDFTSIIYMLASGQDKSRTDKDAVLRKTAHWTGTILSTAEHSLSNKSKQNAGIQMRLFEFGNVTWTKSAENANALKEGLLQNYGHVGPKFAEYLLNIGNEAVKERWDGWSRTILEQMGDNDPFAPRLADKVAVLITTADLANESLALGLNLAALQELLIDTVGNSSEERDLATKAYESFQESLVRYAANFAGESLEFTGPQLWGKIIEPGRGKQRQVYILPEVFREWMDNSGFVDVNVILGLWRDRGWLECEEKRFTRKRSIRPGAEVRVHVVRLPSNLDALPSRERKTKNPTTLPGGADAVFDS